MSRCVAGCTQRPEAYLGPACVSNLAFCRGGTQTQAAKLCCWEAATRELLCRPQSGCNRLLLGEQDCDLSGSPCRPGRMGVGEHCAAACHPPRGVRTCNFSRSSSCLASCSTVQGMEATCQEMLLLLLLLLMPMAGERQPEARRCGAPTWSCSPQMTSLYPALMTLVDCWRTSSCFFRLPAAAAAALFTNERGADIVSRKREGRAFHFRPKPLSKMLGPNSSQCANNCYCKGCTLKAKC